MQVLEREVVMNHLGRKTVCLCLVVVLMFSNTSFAMTETLTGTIIGYGYTQTMTVTNTKVEGSISCSAADSTAIGIFAFYYPYTGSTGSYVVGSIAPYTVYNSNMTTYTYASWTPSYGFITHAKYRSFVNGTQTRPADMYVYAN